ncbi:MAG TPA: RIP metalloprotease RseP [Cytophagaceae bacterium]|jgi:regulator of sigma E protease|nr:RIP metalloprotease RseP [Cytophagaceae bacterium]
MDILGVVVMAAQLILGLSILVGVHELGHMVAAKYFGMRVEKFSIGFPPKIFGKQVGETEYSVGMIPLGGFVKISGMVDESMDTEQMAQEPKPWEFRSKPAWQRLIVMLGGIIVNIVTGIVIFICLTYTYGEEYLPMSEVNKNGIYAHESAKKIGIENGDKILKVNGVAIEDFADTREVYLGSNGSYTILRGDKEIEIKIPATLLNELSDKEKGFITPLEPFKVGELNEKKNAFKAGLKEGDSILAVNDTKIVFFQYFSDLLKANKNKEVNLKVKRGDSLLTIPVRVDSMGTIGFNAEIKFNPKTREYTFAESIPRGTYKSFKVIFDQLRAFTKIFRRELDASNSLGSFFTIAKVYSGEWHWDRFWGITAMLSMVLAFMNILPIPALDGGHVVFLLYEMITGRKPTDKFLENAQKVGMVILLALMVFALGNDIFRNFFK